LADDNADMREYIRRLLAARYDVTAVADGLAARDAVSRRPPDLVLSDVMMPGLDGFGLLRELRADQKTQGLPVILLSARAGEEARVEGLRAGADDYLTKPFSARELLARVDSVLEIARLRREALERERRLARGLRESEERYRRIAETAHEGIWLVDLEARTLFINERMAAMLGRCPDEVVGRRVPEFCFPEDVPLARTRVGANLGGQSEQFDFRFRRADGAELLVLACTSPMTDADGVVVGALGMFSDITDRRRAEEEIVRLNRDLQRRVTEFQALLEVIPIGIAVAEDPDCRRIWSNPAMSRLLRLPERANISLSAPPDEHPGFRVFEDGRELRPDELPMQQAIATGREVRGVKHDLLLPDGTRVSLLNYAVPLYDEVGRVRGGLYAGVDVTDREQTERALRETERRFRAVFNQQFQFMALLAPDGAVLEANETCFQATGIPRERVMGYPFWDTPWWDRLPEMRERWKQFVAEALRTGGPVTGEMDYSMADGTVRHATTAVTGLRDEAGRVATVIVEGRDDTDRRRAEEALRQSEQRWRTMAEALPNLVWTDLPDGQCDWLSSQWGKYTGIPETELLGLNWLEMVIHPDDRERTLKCWQDACADRGDYDLEYRIRRHDGQYRWFKTRGVPVRDDAGRIVYWFGTCTDIEDHKRAEEALREADRRKDEFLATLAHELRNPLAPLRNALQILRMPRLDAATAERSREMMERQVQHLVRLVDDLLDVSRVMRGKINLRRERVELASVVARAVETAQPLIDVQGHAVSVDLPDESLPLDADPVRLAQVVGNLLTNAAKYTEPGGHIWLTARREGGEVVLTVRDTGIGISPAMLPKVFDLFVQADHAANRSQGGLGIGLTLVKSLVEMHDGSVVARSDGQGRGSEFLVRLPLAAPREPDHGGGGESRPAEAARGRRLMVIDDNRDAAESLAMLLRLQGHEVRVAHDGPAALELLGAYRPEFVFLDLGMPGMDGYEVARRMRKRPGLAGVRLAALTGWGQSEDRRRSAEAGFDYHLVKPVEPAVLEKLLRVQQPATG
jgi:PAS domain S-box-containing protein